MLFLGSLLVFQFGRVQRIGPLTLAMDTSRVFSTSGVVFFGFFFGPKVSLALYLYALSSVRPIATQSLKILEYGSLGPISILSLVVSICGLAIRSNTSRLVTSYAISHVNGIGQYKTVQGILRVPIQYGTMCVFLRRVRIAFRRTWGLAIVERISLPFRSLARPIRLLFLHIRSFHITSTYLFVFPIYYSAVFDYLVRLFYASLSLRQLSKQSSRHYIRKLMRVYL